MYLPKGKTEKTEEDTMETKITTAEKLGMTTVTTRLQSGNTALRAALQKFMNWLKHRKRQVLEDANAGFQGSEEKKGLRMQDMQWHGHLQK